MGADLFHADGNDEADRRFSQFCEFAQKPKSKDRLLASTTFSHILQQQP